MNERTMRLWLGMFVVAALLLLGTLVVLFRSLPRFVKSTTPYTIVFPDAPGVSPGTPVRRSGVRIGEVTSVSLDDETGKVRVGVAIDKEFGLRRDEQPVLVTGLLGSDATIDFMPKPPVEGQVADRSRVLPGEELVGSRQVTVNALLNRASEVVPATQETMNDIRKSLQRLEKMSPLMEETMKEYRDLAKDLRGAVPDLRKTNDEVRDLAKSARETLPEIRRDLDDIAATARTYTKLGERLDNFVQANQDKVVKAIDALNETLKSVAALVGEENQRNVNAVLKNVRAASDKADEIAKNVADISREGRTTVRRLNDSLVKADEVMLNIQKATKPFAERGDAIVRNLDETLVTLNKTLTDTSQLIRAVGQSDGTLSRFLTDPTLFNRIDETVCGVQRALPRVDRILKDFEVFADKLARHPELLGVRGAVAPGPGIK